MSSGTVTLLKNASVRLVATIAQGCKKSVSGMCMRYMVQVHICTMYVFELHDIGTDLYYICV